MASVVGAGFDLSFLDKLVSYEKQIEKTKQATIDYGKNAVKMFSDIANNGIEPTLAMLKQQKAEFDRLSRINLKGASDEFKALRNEIKSSLDSINPLINALTSIGKAKPSTMTSALDALEKKIKSLKGNIGIFNELNSAGLANKSDKEEVSRHEAELKKLEAAYLALSNAKRTLNQAQPHTNTVTNQESIESLKYKDAMEAMRQYYKEQEKEAEKEKKRLEDLAKAKARYDSQSRKDRYSSYVTSYEGALAYADRVSKKNKQQLQNLSTDRDRHSVDNLRKAISNLETAMSKQNQSTSQGRKRYQELEKQLVKTKAEMVKLTGEIQKQGPMFGKLGQMAAAWFSISAIKGYVSQMVKVRGEIEKQQKAMQIIIGNKEQANRVWEQTVELAKKSPFTIQELVTHTRQLAAYRVETKKLHDTTKMLADVSAGLGVDMSRLILAFGQVKSASFLRGTELRQFTEAGIPMLEELSKHFTELYGKVITVDDAFEMISKRQVEFQDVEKVFKNMTSEGGVFYNMQEEMSNTTVGRISALKDSITLMFNEIGESQQGTINWVIGFLRKLVDNWQAVAAVIKGVVVAYTSYQVATTLVMWVTGGLKTTMYALAAGETAAVAATNSLTLAFARLGNAMRGASVGSKFGWIGTIIGLVAGVATTWWSMSDASEETEEKVSRNLEEIEQNVQQLQARAEQLNRTVNKLGDAFKKAVDESNITDQRLQLQKLIDLANEEYKMKIAVEVSGLSAEELKSKMAELQETLLNINRYASINATKILEDPSFDGLVTQYLPALETKLQSLLSAYDSVGENLRAFGVPKDILLLKPEETALEAARRIHDELKNTYNYDRTEQVAKLNGKYLSGANQTLAKFLSDIRELALLETQGYFGMGNLLRSLSIESPRNMGILDEVMFKTFELLTDQKDFDPVIMEYLIMASNTTIGTNIGAVETNSVKAWQERYNAYLLKIRETTKKEVEQVFGNDFEAWADTNLDASGAFQHIKLIDESQAHRTVEEQKELIKGYLDDAKEIVETYEQGIGEGGPYTKQEYNAAKLELNQLKELYRFFGAVDGDKKTVKEKIKLLEDIHKKYLELKKTFGDLYAEQEIRKSYGDIFNETFKDTGLTLDSAIQSFQPFILAASSAGEDAGKALTDSMKEKLEEVTSSGTYIRKSTQEIFQQLKDEEGFKNEAYPDAGGGWSIGIASQIWPDGTKVKEGDYWTDQQIWDYSQDVIAEHERRLNEVLDLHKDIYVTQEQYNQLLSQTWQSGTASPVFTYAKDAEAFAKWLKEIDGMDIVRIFNRTDANGNKYLERKKVGTYDIDVDAIMEQYNALTDVNEKMALVMEYTSLRTKQYGDTTNYMISRSKNRAEAFRGNVTTVYQQIATEVDKLDRIDFMTKEDMVESLNRLKELAKAAGPEVERALEETISGYEAEVNVRIKEDADKQLIASVEQLFDMHSITVELKKLQVPQDVAKALWGVDYITSSGLMNEVISTYTKNLSGETKDIVSRELAKGAGANWEEVRKYIGDTQVDQIKKDLEKVSDLEDKDLKERMGKYIEYSRQSLGEMGKIRLEQVNKMLDIQEAFKTYDTDSEDVKAIKKRERERALAKSIEDANNSLSKLEWEEFRKSDTFSSLFTDLDVVSNKVLNDVITRLNNFKKQWKDLPIDQMKEVDDLIRKAERARDVERGLGREKRRLRRNIREDGRSMEDAQIDAMTAESERARLEKEIQMIDMINLAKDAGLTKEQIKLSLESSYHYLLEKDANALDEIKNKNKGLISDEKEKVKSAKNRIQDELDLQRIYEEQSNAINEVDEMINDLYKSFRDLHDVVADEDEALLVFADAGMDMLSLVLQTWSLQASLNAAAVSATGFGAALNTAMGVIGWIVMGVQLITKAFTAIAEYNDKIIEQEVEAQQRTIDDAISKYEELENAIEEAYSTQQLQNFTDDMIENIDIAIEAQKKIIEARRSAKHSDEVGHEDWEALKEAEDALKELEERREEGIKDVFSRLTDGILDSTLDAAKEFTEAWYDAFKETGDGLSGLEENFEEMFMNLAKNQAAEQITGAYVEQWKGALQKFINQEKGDSELTPEEAKLWAEQVKASFPQLNDALEAFLGTIHEGLGGSGSNSLSELQKGIQGVTEQTAQVIESILNSMRYYTMDSNAQLAQQTKVMTDMFTFIKGLSTNASNKGNVAGAVLKVAIA